MLKRLGWGRYFGYFVTVVSALLCVFGTFHSQAQQEEWGRRQPRRRAGPPALVLVASLPALPALTYLTEKKRKTLSHQEPS